MSAVWSGPFVPGPELTTKNAKSTKNKNTKIIPFEFFVLFEVQIQEIPGQVSGIAVSTDLPFYPGAAQCGERGYTARTYLDDMPGGNGWVEFELYYIDQPPEALGLAVPWEN